MSMAEAQTENTQTDAPAESPAEDTQQQTSLENSGGSNDEATDAAAEKPAEPPAPEWFMKDKFASLEEQAKAYPELLSKMGKNWGAPKDDYILDAIEPVIKEDPMFNHLKPKLKELGLSQDGFNNLIKSYRESQVEVGNAASEQLQKELTQKEAATVKVVDEWMTNSFSKEDADTMRSWILSIKDFKLLNQLRAMLPAGSNVPSSTMGTSAKFETSKDVTNEKVKYRTEVSKGMRVEDKNFENELQQRFRDAFTREEAAKRK